MLRRLLLLTIGLLLSTLALAQPGRIFGKVTNQAGEPMEGVQVYLLEFDRETLTDAEGKYLLEKIPPQTYTLIFETLGKREELTVKIDGPAEVDAILELEYELPEVLITDVTRATEVMPVTYTNLTEAEIERENVGQDVPYILRLTPSAVVTSDAGTGIGYTGIRIRGTDATRINVTINGIPLNDAESQGVFWVNLPDIAGSADGIQVQRGVGTSTNGGGAFGATINLQTIKLEREPYIELKSTVGSFNTLRNTVAASTGLIDNRFSLEARYSNIQSDGYIDRATADLQSLYVSAGYLDDRNSIRLIAFAGRERTYQAWYGVEESLLDDPDTRTFNEAGTDRPGEPYEDQVDDYGQDHYQAIFAHQLTPELSLNYAFHYTRGGGFYEEYRGGEFVADYTAVDNPAATTDLIRRLHLDNDFYGTTFSLAYDRDGGLLTLGGAYNEYLGDHFGTVEWTQDFGNLMPHNFQFYFNDAFKSDGNLFLRYTRRFGDKWSAYGDVQGRQIFYRFDGFDRNANVVTQDVTLTFFNPKAGVQYRPNPSNEVYLYGGIANREPNRNDFTESTPDSRPLPERLYNGELGWKGTYGKLGVGANAYFMYYEDQLVVNGQLNDVGAQTRINVPESYRAGLELVWDLPIYRGLRFNGNATYSQNKVVEFTQFFDDFDTGGQQARTFTDTDLALSPEWVAAGELGYTFFKRNDDHRLTLSWVSKYVGDQFIDNTSNPEAMIDAYLVNDVRLYYIMRNVFGKEVRLNAQVINVLDEVYENNAYTYQFFSGGQLNYFNGFYPQAGRNYLVGVEVLF